MEHKYSEVPSEKELNEITDFTGNDNELNEPSKYSVDFILSYSKSLSVQVNKKFGSIFLNLN
tara:strand:- start:434 stop:619 length:186 start_codon:yes stop_codon:yes gene_type:complete